jgi:hypothetical protein
MSRRHYRRRRNGAAGGLGGGTIKNERKTARWAAAKAGGENKLIGAAISIRCLRRALKINKPSGVKAYQLRWQQCMGAQQSSRRFNRRRGGVAAPAATWRLGGGEARIVG